MYEVTLLPLAAIDVKQASFWYNSKQRGLGKRFIHEVRATISIIKKNPNLCAIRFENVRTALTEVFPYMIHYFIDENRSEIIITAVLHTSRDPQIWQRDQDNL